MKQIYKTKKAFMVPFTMTAALLFALLALSFFNGQSWEQILIAVLCAVTLAIAVEAFEREVAVSENGLSIKKFFRVKHFTWAEITHLGVVVMRNKAYFLLNTTKGFYILSNLLQDHAILIRYLADQLKNEKVETEVGKYLESPIERTSLIVITWIALIIIIAIVLSKLIKL